LAQLSYRPDCSVVYNFTVNRRFTFKSANNIPKAMMQLGLYYAIFTPLSTWWGMHWYRLESPITLYWAEPWW
jgi:putative flippase GtrA